ncbi:DUF1465 family protein [Thalassospira lucentensis]|uniref:DUF1465 family protein n=2 Tax=Thalassospira lucentensis TaxID=168935 RepID=UPI0020CA4DEF|nr:DUF1465 family protein [Thalassospira lucentensis]
MLNMDNEHPAASNSASYKSNFAVVHFSRTYDEAFTLLVEARNYLSHHRSKREKPGRDMEAMTKCVEEMRMTTRLIHAMGWLMTVRAVEAGEIDWEDAVDTDNLMTDLRVCIDDQRADCTLLSPELLDLMERAHGLYMRAARMELQVAARCNA